MTAMRQGFTVLELLVAPTIEFSTGGREAENYFFFFTVEFLYLQERGIY